MYVLPCSARDIDSRQPRSFCMWGKSWRIGPCSLVFVQLECPPQQLGAASLWLPVCPAFALATPLNRVSLCRYIQVVVVLPKNIPRISLSSLLSSQPDTANERNDNLSMALYFLSIRFLGYTLGCVRRLQFHFINLSNYF